MTIGVWEEAAGLELIPGMCRETQLPWQGACSFPARGIQDLGQGISGSAAASFPFKTSWLGWRSIPVLPLFSSLVYYQCLEYEFSPQPDPAPGSEFSLSLRLIIPCPSFIASPLRVGSGSSPPGLHILQIFAAGLFCPESLLDCAEPWARGRACLAAGCSSTGDSWDSRRR